MSWRYKLQPVIIWDGEHNSTHYAIGEDFGEDNGYAQLNINNWIFTTKTEAIEMIRMILKDLEEGD